MRAFQDLITVVTSTASNVANAEIKTVSTVVSLGNDLNNRANQVIQPIVRNYITPTVSNIGTQTIGFLSKNPPQEIWHWANSVTPNGLGGLLGSLGLVPGTSHLCTTCIVGGGWPSQIDCNNNIGGCRSADNSGYVAAGNFAVQHWGCFAVAGEAPSYLQPVALPEKCWQRPQSWC